MVSSPAFWMTSCDGRYHTPSKKRGWLGKPPSWRYREGRAPSRSQSQRLCNEHISPKRPCKRSHRRRKIKIAFNCSKFQPYHIECCLKGKFNSSICHISVTKSVTEMWQNAQGLFTCISKYDALNIVFVLICRFRQNLERLSAMGADLTPPRRRG